MIAISNKFKFCVYAHRCLSTEKVFYVGCGKLERAHSDHRLRKWHETVAALPGYFEVIILQRCKTKQAALTLEAEFISLYRNLNHPLINERVPKIYVRKDKSDLDLGTFLKEGRKRMGLTQKQYAKEFGFDVKLIQRIEQGHSGVKLFNVQRVLVPLNATIRAVPL